MTEQYKKCPACGQLAFVSAQGCSKCGHQFRTAFAPPAPDRTLLATGTPPAPVGGYAPVAASASPLACVVCHAEQGQKVSAIVQAGVWQTASSGTSVGVGHVVGGPNFGTVGLSHTRSVSATGLAQMLAPPAQPALRSSGRGCGPAGLSLLAMCLGSIAFSCGVAQWWVHTIMFGSVALGLTLLAIVIARQERVEAKRELWQHQQATQRWGEAMQRWDALWYCSRCDHVYVPQTPYAVRADQIQTML